ncbi:class I SAM-dependent methyltransferase [Mesorhizobium sp. M0130]
MAILDAGCGAGLVDVELESRGFRLTDGFDRPEEMAEKARQTRAYRNVRGDVDLKGLPSDYFRASYDLTVCCRVFTLGHVGPDGLRELAHVTRSNETVIASVHKSYAEPTSFEDHVRPYLPSLRFCAAIRTPLTRTRTVGSSRCPKTSEQQRNGVVIRLPPISGETGNHCNATGRRRRLRIRRVWVPRPIQDRVTFPDAFRVSTLHEPHRRSDGPTPHC